jgi:hypothetical protein
VTLGGRTLAVHLARDAVTAGDVWLYDDATRVAVLGDLVTLPVPFLDTACPDGWKLALNEVAGTPFERAVPGHGVPLTRVQFLLYQDAFGALVDCANSARPEDECASHWTDSIRSLLTDDALEHERARKMVAYYVGMLRANHGRSKYCESPRGSNQVGLRSARVAFSGSIFHKDFPIGRTESPGDGQRSGINSQRIGWGR